MADTVRLTLEIERDTLAYFQTMARERGMRFGQLLACGITAVQVAREQRALGRRHLGFVSDRTKLDAELILFP